MTNGKKVLLLLIAVLVIFSATAIAAPKQWVVGFSQIGAESEWRTADTVSVQNAFLDDPSFTLIYSDAQQKQENQIKALRSFIARKVNCIVFTALVETGYGPVLQEAQKAKIPVIMIDRDVAPEDQKFRLTIMGSDMVKEGEKVGMWLETNLKKMGLDDGSKDIDFAIIDGTVGSGAMVGRKEGFDHILAKHPNWKVMHEQTGNFTTSEGKQVMEAFLKADPKIQVLFTHNDGMGLGATKPSRKPACSPVRISSTSP